MKHFEYVQSVEYLFEEIFLIPFDWVKPDHLVLMGAQQDGWTPEQFAIWLGKDRELIAIPEENKADQGEG
ncbi:MAG TPA: hypothetical protein VMU69_20035 [Bradyrhizobium sp.]|nr:hypothetical protein [Bradyrhizobium sp.]